MNKKTNVSATVIITSQHYKKSHKISSELDIEAKNLYESFKKFQTKVVSKTYLLIQNVIVNSHDSEFTISGNISVEEQQKTFAEVTIDLGNYKNKNIEETLEYLVVIANKVAQSTVQVASIALIRTDIFKSLSVGDSEQT